MSKVSNNEYEKSNKIETVALSRFSKEEFARLLADKGDRQKNAQAVINYLCDKFKIPHASVTVTDTCQPHATGYTGALKSKTLGTYTSGLMVITMYNKTAIKKQTVAIKTFADTLLHEFMHHYDYTYLKFSGSAHTAGFYKRISDLKAKLM